MNKLWRKILEKIHPEGIPQPFSRLYSRISSINSFQIHYELVAKEISSYCKTGRLLDIGTGPAWLLIKIRETNPDIKIAGIDISSGMIKTARANLEKHGLAASIDLNVATVTNIPYPDNSIDLVTSTGSLHHWKNKKTGLNEIYRVLKPGGYALLYDLIRHTPKDIVKNIRNEIGRFQTILLWLHSFQEPFYSISEMETLPLGTGFKKGAIHFTGALCCLLLHKNGFTEPVLNPPQQ